MYPQSPHQDVRWQPFINESQTTMPAYGIGMLKTSTKAEKVLSCTKRIEDVEFLRVYRPDYWSEENNDPAFIVLNGPQPVEPTKTGLCTQDAQGILVDRLPAVPSTSVSSFGPEKNSWFAKVGNAFQRIMLTLSNSRHATYLTARRRQSYAVASETERLNGGGALLYPYDSTDPNLSWRDLLGFDLKPIGASIGSIVETNTRFEGPYPWNYSPVTTEWETAGAVTKTALYWFTVSIYVSDIEGVPGQIDPLTVPGLEVRFLIDTGIKTATGTKAYNAILALTGLAETTRDAAVGIPGRGWYFVAGWLPLRRDWKLKLVNLAANANYQIDIREAHVSVVELGPVPPGITVPWADDLWKAA